MVVARGISPVRGICMAAACAALPLRGEEPVMGFADTHNHQFANLAFGGLAVHGKPFGPIDSALPWCTPAHGPGGIRDAVYETLRGGAQRLRAGHLVGGYPQFDGWPRFTSSIHQMVYEDWLHRAFQGGLRLMVMLAVNNEAICSLPGFTKAEGRTCEDKEAIDWQINHPTLGVKAMERHIDAKHGGPGKGWYRIVYTAREARAAIAKGQLAVVLGAEVDHFLDCRRGGGCDEDSVRARLSEYHAMGLRHVFPIHFVENAFGSPAYYIMLNQTRTRPCAEEGYAHRVNPLAGPACGAGGLTTLGKFLVREVIGRGMIVDIDHMSYLARRDAFAIAEELSAPVVSGHSSYLEVSAGEALHEGNLKGEEIERIRRLGGLVSAIASPGNHESVITWRGEGQPVVPHRCGRTSQTFAQTYLYAVKKMGGLPVAIGSDFNAGPDLPGPRFGARNAGDPPMGACPGGWEENSVETSPVSYPFQVPVPGGAATLGRQTAGRKTFDINYDGLAHAGLLPDFFADLRAQGLRAEDLDPMYRSAEGYIRVWERLERQAQAVRPGRAGPAAGGGEARRIYSLDGKLVLETRALPGALGEEIRRAGHRGVFYARAGREAGGLIFVDAP